MVEGRPNPKKCFQLSTNIVDDRWVNGRGSEDFDEVFESSKRSRRWLMHWWFGVTEVDKVSGMSKRIDRWPMGKRGWWRHHPRHATTTSTWHATSPKLTPQDDVSRHVSIHLSCHVSSCHVNQQKWSMIRSTDLGKVYSTTIEDRWSSMGRWSGVSRSCWKSHFPMKVVDSGWLGRSVWSCVQVDRRGVGLMVDSWVGSLGKNCAC